MISSQTVKCMNRFYTFNTDPLCINKKTKNKKQQKKTPKPKSSQGHHMAMKIQLKHHTIEIVSEEMVSIAFLFVLKIRVCVLHQQSHINKGKVQLRVLTSLLKLAATSEICWKWKWGKDTNI